MRRLFLSFSALIGAFVIGVMSLGSGVAFAAGTNTIVSSSPASGEIVALAPKQIQLKFAENVGDVAQMALSMACAGKLMGLGAPQVGSDGVTVSAALTQLPSNGKCVVSWSLADGSTGSFSFTSQAEGTTTSSTPANGGGGGTTTGTATSLTPKLRLGGPLGLARVMMFVAVGGLFGGLIFIRIVWPEGVEYAVCERYFRIISIAAVASMVLMLIITRAHDNQLSLGSSISPTSWGTLLHTNGGRALLVRFVATAALAYYAWIPARIFQQSYTPPIVASFFATAVSFGFDRAGGRLLPIGVLASSIHAALALVWVGSILVLWRVILRGPGDRDLVEALHGWARLSNLCVIGMVVSGVVQVWRLDGISIINSGHGRLMLFKVLLVGMLLFVSNGIRNFISRALKRARMLNQKAVFKLARPVGVQFALSIVVLAASSWLMAMRPPYLLLPDKGPKTAYAIVQNLQGPDNFHVRISINNGNVGVNTMLIELFGPKRIQNFTVSLAPDNPAYSGYLLYVPITRPGGAYVSDKVNMRLLAPGTWKLTVAGTTTTGDLKPLTGQFTIADGTTVTTVPNAGSSQAATTTTVAGAQAGAPAVGATTVPPVAATTLPTTSPTSDPNAATATTAG